MPDHYLAGELVLDDQYGGSKKEREPSTIKAKYGMDIGLSALRHGQTMRDTNPAAPRFNARDDVDGERPCKRAKLTTLTTAAPAATHSANGRCAMMRRPCAECIRLARAPPPPAYCPGAYRPDAADEVREMFRNEGTRIWGVTLFKDSGAKLAGA